MKLWSDAMLWHKAEFYGAVVGGVGRGADGTQMVEPKANEKLNSDTPTAAC